MVNKVFTNYRDEVLSYPTGEKLVGIHAPGRYSGFDVFAGTGLNVTLAHAGRVLKSSKTVSGVITQKTFGAVIMPCGSVIHSEMTNGNDTIPFVITDNGGNPSPRYDLVVCEHEFVDVTGGVIPTFHIQVGPAGGTIPTVANPAKQVIIGVIKINAGGGNFAAMTYTKSPVPLVGDSYPSELFDQLGLPAAFLLKENKSDADALRIRVTNLENSQIALNNKLNVFSSDGGIVLWGKAANLIPAGWAEWTPLKGRIPIGFDPAVLEFNALGKTGGSATHTNTLAEMVQHRHQLRTTRVSIDHTGSGEDYLNDSGADLKYNTEPTGAATPAAYSILNPYRVVMYIHYTG